MLFEKVAEKMNRVPFLLLLCVFICLLQNLGAHSTLDWSANQSASEVYRGGPRYHLLWSCRPELYTQWWLQERCAIFARSGCHGRCSSLHKPRKARGDQRTHIRLYQEVLAFHSNNISMLNSYIRRMYSSRHILYSVEDFHPRLAHSVWLFCSLPE